MAPSMARDAETTIEVSALLSIIMAPRSLPRLVHAIRPASGTYTAPEYDSRVPVRGREPPAPRGRALGSTRSRDPRPGPDPLEDPCIWPCDAHPRASYGARKA